MPVPQHETSIPAAYLRGYFQEDLGVPDKLPSGLSWAASCETWTRSLHSPLAIVSFSTHPGGGAIFTHRLLATYNG